MKVVNLAPSTSYTEVVSLAVDALVSKDFEFQIDANGAVEGLYIFDTPDTATLIEMDEMLFIDVYDRVVTSEGLSPESRNIVDAVATTLH